MLTCFGLKDNINTEIVYWYIIDPRNRSMVWYDAHFLILYTIDMALAAILNIGDFRTNFDDNIYE